jgi:hypothetical protein
MASAKTNLMAYLKPRFPGTYETREPERAEHLERFRAVSSQESNYSQEQISQAIKDYFMKELKCKHAPLDFSDMIFENNGSRYGVLLTFSEKDHLLLPDREHSRFWVTVNDFSQPTIVSDEIGETALEALAQQRGKNLDHFK